LDLKSGKRLWELKVGGKPDGLSKNNNDLWVNSRAGIVKIDLSAVWKDHP